MQMVGGWVAGSGGADRVVHAADDGRATHAVLFPSTVLPQPLPSRPPPHPPLRALALLPGPGSPPGILQLHTRPSSRISECALISAPQAQDWPGRPGRDMGPTSPLELMLQGGGGGGGGGGHRRGCEGGQGHCRRR